jgi:hypothetical protein
MPSDIHLIPRCQACHRPLKTLEAQRRGFGPHCYRSWLAYLSTLDPDDPRRLQTARTPCLFPEEFHETHRND